MKEYVTEALIRATPERVWQILTDGDGYADWNPEIVRVTGRMAPNERITVRIKVSGGAIRTLSMRVTAYEAPTRMEWLGGLSLGLFVGRRIFTVTPANGGAMFRLHLKMSGLLAPLILESVGDRQPEIDSFSSALRARAESGN